MLFRSKLTKAIALFQKFQFQLWEPEKIAVVPRNEGDSSPSSPVRTSTKSIAQDTAPVPAGESDNGKKKNGNSDADHNDEETTAESHTMETTGGPTTAEENDGNSTAVGAIMTEDDPLTRMPMHESIIIALEAYMLTISHPQMSKSSSKIACEQALECIDQLVIRE